MKHIKTILALLMIASVSLNGCGSAPKSSGATPAAPIQITETIQATATARPLLTPTQTITPTLMPTITITATPEPIRRTPPTLMLHRNSASFDTVQFLKEFVVILKQNDMHVITYSDISKNPNITASEQGKLFIITIDDISLRYPMHSSVLEMIAILRAAGYVAVLGVVTDSDYVDPDTLTMLRELSKAGWEIASHTDQHRNLGEMEKVSPRYVYTEVQTSVDKIEKAVGVRPYTLVLPEGQMVNDPRFIKRAGIVWIVGINGGVMYDSRKDMFYVGREGPDGSAAETFRIMTIRFNP